MQRVCECADLRPLELYLSFVEDFVRAEVESGCIVQSSKQPAIFATASDDSATAAYETELQAFWSAEDPRRTLLLHALHGAQEAANADKEAGGITTCHWIPHLLKVCSLVRLQLVITEPARLLDTLALVELGTLYY